jgi:hypothetical protein
MDTTAPFNKASWKATHNSCAGGARRGLRRRLLSKGKMHCTRPFRSALLAMAAVLAACGSTGQSSSSTTAAGDQKPPTALRDVRYCEVIPSVTAGSTVTTSVYNTLSYNLCPPLQWAALTEGKVNQAFGSQSAKLNGPRHWVIDAMQASGASDTGKTFTFGGIEMGLRATLTTQAGQPTVGDQLYVPNEVKRDTVWIYDAGKPIFELTDPQGNVYVMQSYAQMADRTLTIEQLPNLSSKLKLPQGWGYKTETLSSELDLSSNGLATVVNDDLYNSYQKRM